jgi:Fe-S-cluster containining protein
MNETTYDCRRCGACCVHLGSNDGNAYVYLDREEVRRMRRLGLRVVDAARGAHCLASAPRQGVDGCLACVAFEGQLGGRCGCSVYEDRPSVCREFEVGSDLCHEARKRARLPV